MLGTFRGRRPVRRPFPERPFSHDLAAASLPHRHSRIRLHQRCGPEPLRLAVEPFHRHQGARARTGHRHLHAQQPGRHAHERRHRASGLCAPGHRAGRHAGEPLRGQGRRAPPAGRFHPALRVQRAGIRQRGGSMRGRRIRVHPAREHHGRDHRRRAVVPQRGGHPLYRRLQSPRAAQGLRRRRRRLLPPVRRAGARVRGRTPSPRRLQAPEPRGLGRLPALFVRAGHHKLFLLFRRAAELPAPQGEHPYLRPRHAHEPSDRPRWIHALHRGALNGNAVGHRVHSARRGRVHAGGLHHAQRAQARPASAAVHRRAARHHPCATPACERGKNSGRSGCHSRHAGQAAPN